MVRICVMYPNEEGASFNLDYYRDTHMALVHRHLEPHGLIKTGIEKGLAGGPDGAKAPYMCIGSLYFESMDKYNAAMGAVGTVLRDDIPNFTNVTPTPITHTNTNIRQGPPFRPF